MENLVLCRDIRLIEEWVVSRLNMISDVYYTKEFDNKYLIFEISLGDIEVHIKINIKKFFPLKKVEYKIWLCKDLIFEGKTRIEVIFDQIKDKI